MPVQNTVKLLRMFEASGCYCEGRSTNSALKFAGICHVFTMFLVGFTIDLLGFAVALLGFNHSAIRI